MRNRPLWLATLIFVAGCVAIEQPAPMPAPLVATEPTVPERWILVHKTNRTLSLYEDQQVVKVYSVVLGKDPVWAKLHEGDLRTPEGEYRIVKKYFHPFWERFMLLDYPTPLNHEIYEWSRGQGLLPARRGATPGVGGAIGIHGTEDESLNRRGVDWTKGCISLFNEDVKELYDSVAIGTRVVIQR